MVPDRSHLRLTTQRSAAALDSLLHRAQQHLIAVWLGQKLHRSRSDSSDSRTEMSSSTTNTIGVSREMRDDRDSWKDALWR
jgi:hypothetical protein